MGGGQLCRVFLQFIVCLFQGLLGPLPFGDVAYGPDKYPAVLQPQFADRDAQRKDGPVLFYSLLLAFDSNNLCNSCFEVVFDIAVVPAFMRLRHQNFDILADNFWSKVPKDFFSGGTERLDNTQK